ncbi:MAG: recombination mediator RecR [Zavarzinella sp.]
MNESLGPLGRLISELVKLPGIGPKSAERIAHFLLAENARNAVALADALHQVARDVHPCPICFNLTDHEKCEICASNRRDTSIICVVETPRDLAMFERAGTFRGVYHVLGGRLAPLSNMGPDKLTFDALLERAMAPEVLEIILATSPTMEGDGTALFAANLLQRTNKNVTRLARGLPSGASIELANTQMLADALEGRRSMD